MKTLISLFLSPPFTFSLIFFMATAGDGRTPYQSGGAGGKLRKKPYRRNIPVTPYDRPPTSLRNNNSNQSLLTKIVDPASRLISAGAHRLFDVFRKRLPSLSLQAPPGLMLLMLIWLNFDNLGFSALNFVNLGFFNCLCN